MGQYIIGTVDVTNGSQDVVGIGTEWNTYAHVGDLFKVSGINTIYEIGVVTDDTHISLSANWTGSTLVDQDYQITVDFTPNFNLTEIWAGDRDWPYHLTKTIRDIDTKFVSGLILLTVISYDDATLSGDPLVIRFSDGGSYKYIKVYPTISATNNPTSDSELSVLCVLNNGDISGDIGVIEIVSGGTNYYIQCYPTIDEVVYSQGGIIRKVPGYAGVDISGTPRVIKINIDGVSYYTKVYPTSSHTFTTTTTTTSSTTTTTTA